jgi:hypothetical protein
MPVHKGKEGLRPPLPFLCPFINPSEWGRLKSTKLLIAKRNGKGNTSALPICGVALSEVPARPSGGEVRPCSYPFRLNVVGSYLIGAPDLSEWIHPGGNHKKSSRHGQQHYA